MIRLQRVGKKNQPSYRVVVTDKRWSAKSGKAKEVVGWSNPRAHAHAFNKERVLYWIGKGAQASGTVHNMLIREGVIKGAKAHVSPNVKKAAEKKEGAEIPKEASADEKPQ